MICNHTKCKELVVKRKNNNPQCEQICNNLSLLGVTLQGNCEFSERVTLKLGKVNIILYVLGSLRKEQCSQVEIDQVFTEFFI